MLSTSKPGPSNPEYVPEWDVTRYADDSPVTISAAQMDAIWHAVNVVETVRKAEGSESLWRNAKPNLRKSRLLGRMLLSGLPPTRTRPPRRWGGPDWTELPCGDPFQPSGERSGQARIVSAKVMHTFDPVSEGEWSGIDNNTKAAIGRDAFLSMSNAKPATPAEVRTWLQGLGSEFHPGRSNWVQAVVSADLPPRWVNIALTSRCIDAFLGDGRKLQGCELKVSGSDGVCGLTINEERLLRAGHLKVFFVNPPRGLIGEADTKELLAVPRRIDGIPIGQTRVQWIQ